MDTDLLAEVRSDMLSYLVDTCMVLHRDVSGGATPVDNEGSLMGIPLTPPTLYVNSNSRGGITRVGTTQGYKTTGPEFACRYQQATLSAGRGEMDTDARIEEDVDSTVSLPWNAWGRINPYDRLKITLGGGLNLGDVDAIQADHSPFILEVLNIAVTSEQISLKVSTRRIS